MYELTYFEDKAGKWRWRLVATRNGKIVAASSQGFHDRTEAEDNLYRTRDGIADALNH